MITPTFFLSLFLGTAPLLAPQVASESTGASEKESPFGPPLIVNGQRITDAEFRRYFVFGLGANQLEKRKYDVFLHEEVKRRVADGASPEEFAVTDEMVDREIEKTRADFAKRYPSLDFDIETVRAFQSMDLYRQQIAQQQLFDRLFLPADPDNWPELTKEAIRASGGDMFLEDAQQDYARRVAYAAEKGLAEVPPPSPMWQDVWRSMALEMINTFIKAEADPTKLPPGVAVCCEGQNITIDEVFEDIRHVLNEDKLREARHWLALMTAIEQRLKKEEVLLTYEEYLAQSMREGTGFHEHVYVYQTLALSGLGYPSTYLYFDEQRLEQSYRKLLEKLVDWEEELEKSLSRTDWITGLAEVNSEMILISAFDFRNNRWKDDGWKWAEARAEDVRKELEESDGAKWGELLELHSEFYDPPPPEDGSTAELYLLNEGRFGSQGRNDLLGCLGESEYTILMYGNSVADHVFFEQEPGGWEGPYKGLYGYYFTKVLSRQPFARPLDLDEEVHRKTAEVYYLRNAFVQFAREVEKESEFVGWAP
jgi:hypothetical protein